MGRVHLSTTTAWESGLTCDAEDCGGEIPMGAEYLYWYGRKLHPRCAARDAASRREVGAEDPGALMVAQRLLETRSRVILTRRQLRDLVALAVAQEGFDPVRRPDAGTRCQWYGRLNGWSTKRVKDGLSGAEVAGMWLDFMDIGRMPPLRLADLEAIINSIGLVINS
jgi:hypothetical protein